MITRRTLLRVSGLAGTAALLGWPSRAAMAEPAPETTAIRLPRYTVDVACTAPQWVAEELLAAEGFTRVDYVPAGVEVSQLVAGKVDFIMLDTPGYILSLDAGDPIVLLGGIHGGCYELFGTERVRSIRDLKGKTVAVANAGRRAFVASMATYVGLDPRKDLNFVQPTFDEAAQLLSQGKIDAFLGFPPEPQELRAKQIGHVVVSTAVDRPWSQYFCCMLAGRRDFVRKNPVATKRALRAVVKAADVCSLEPERVARFLVDKGYVKHQDYALQALKAIPYNRWRDYDSADTVRFYALRMHEAGLIKGSPQKLIATGTDWRFINELKKELKA
jgi:NitT/TauT family transport system substrate-binding protein